MKNRLKNMLYTTLLLALLVFGLTSVPTSGYGSYYSEFSFLDYTAEVGGVAQITTDPINWQVNRSMGLDINQDNTRSMDEYFFSVIAPAVTSISLNNPFFPFYHHLVQDVAVSSYSVGTISEDTTNELTLSQTIATSQIEVSTQIIIYNSTYIQITFGMKALVDLGTTELIAYLSPDFAPGELESITTEITDSIPSVVVNSTSGNRFLGIVTEAGVSYDISPWGDGPGTLVSDDGISGILNSVAANGQDSAFGDMDIRLHKTVTSFSQDDQVSLSFVVAMTDDFDDLKNAITSLITGTDDSDTNSTTKDSSSASQSSSSSSETTTTAGSSQTSTSTSSTTSSVLTPTSDNDESNGGFLFIENFPLFLGIITLGVIVVYRKRS